MANEQTLLNREQTVRVQNGWLMLMLLLGLLICDVALFVYSIAEADRTEANLWRLLLCIGSFVVLIILMTGFFTLQPNEARVLVLFGKYRGTVRESGFHWGNPFYSNGQQVGVDGGLSQGESQEPWKGECHPEQDLVAGANDQHRKAEGQRQTRQSDRNRCRHGLARSGYGAGGLRC